MRVEINLPPKVLEKIQEKANVSYQSRKRYIELLCIRDSGVELGKKKKK